MGVEPRFVGRMSAVLITEAQLLLIALPSIIIIIIIIIINVLIKVTLNEIRCRGTLQSQWITVRVIYEGIQHQYCTACHGNTTTEIIS